VPVSSKGSGRGAKGPSTPFGALLLLLFLAGLGVVGAQLWSGRSYYLTPVAERARHEQYWELKPGGSRGLVFGAAGLAMMTVMHVYSARKRLKPLHGLGPLKRWLDFHILLGIFGPLFVVLHSSFKVGGLVAVSFWAMVAVALSGVAGRYLYRQIPRTRAGEALSLAETKATALDLGRRLQEDFGLDANVLAPAEPKARRRGLLRALAHVIWEDLSGAQRRRLRAETAGLALPEADLREVRAVLAQKGALDRRIALWDELHGLFDWWHVIHKPFAIVMYVFVVVHVCVAAATGYAWAR
jgi:hypothetical protein